MKKIALLMVLLCFSFLFCSCGKIDLEGYELIRSAQDEFEKLTSGHITVTDLEKCLLTQELTFKINSENRMMYNYFGTDGELYYFEYHNGTELYWTSDRAADWNIEGLGGENFVLYTDAARHPLAKKGLFFVSPDSVSEATVSVDGEITTITYIYDTQKLNKNAETLLAGLGTLDGFSTEYVIENGRFKSILEKGFLTKDGVLTEVNYLVSIDEENSVNSVDLPVFIESENETE